MARYWATAISLLGFAHMAQAIHYFHGLSSMHDLQMVGIVDEEGMTKKQTLLAFANRECFEELYSLGFPFDYLDLPDEVFEFGQVLIEPQNELTDIFEPSEKCRTFVFAPKGALLTDPKVYTKLTAESQEELEDWFWNQNQAIDLNIINDAEYPVKMYWESRIRKNEENDVMDLKPGGKRKFTTFFGHTFIFRKASDHSFVARVTITDQKGVTMSKVLRDPGNSECLQLNEKDSGIWKGRLSSNHGRLLQNERQPPKVKTYTPMGFEKSRIPDDVYKRLVDFLKANEGRRMAERWEIDDTHVNFYDSMTTVVHLDNNIRQFVFDKMQPLLEKWSGEELDPTSFYGIRRYYEKSWLRDHVDVGETHIISAIFNIDQDVSEPWMLHILDHTGQRHFVEMAPGDMVYYESAVAIHGRPIGVKGSFYDNCFLHYRPMSWGANGSPGYDEEDEREEDEDEDYSEEDQEHDVVEDIIEEDGTEEM